MLSVECCDRIITPSRARSARMGFAPASRWRASSQTKVLIQSQESGRQDSNSKPPPHNQAVTPRDSQGNSQSANPIPDHDLQRVINAWCNLPANLKAAIMAIVGPDSLSHR